MALGFAIGGGADFLPIVKYDARAGRTFRVDRVDGVSIPTEIPFKAIVDLDNVEVGWMHFAAGQAPDLRLYPLGGVWGDQPSPNHKRGVRVLVKLSKDTGGDVRELATSSQAFLRAFDDLHTEYEALKGGQSGKLPVVVIEKTIPVTSKGGGNTSTNYQPVFKIASWAERPADLKATPRGTSTPAISAAPPSTGSTIVAPPRAPVPQSAQEMADDFG